MSKNKPQGKKITYNQLMAALADTARGLQQAYIRIANLEQYIGFYIEFKGREGKRFHRWLDKKKQEAQKEYDLHKNEETDGENLETSTVDEGPGSEGIRT
tara:strand:- start:25 stop:324 length:300 start_codon:yes stop_codon:yes gene_type:complete